MLLAVISDVHANLAAFQAVLADIAAAGAGELLCLGDTVGYGPQPQACLDLLRASNIPSVLGNHEQALIKTYRQRWFNPTARKALRRTADLLAPEALEYMRTLPRALRRHGALFVHGAPPDSVTTYLHELDFPDLAYIFKGLDERVTFAGHTHDLEIIESDGEQIRRDPLGKGPAVLDPAHKYIVNVGSVGQPRDGQSNDAKYVLWDPDAHTLDVRFVPYDIATTARLIRDSGLPGVYADRLTFAGRP